MYSERHLLPPCLLHSYSFLFKGDGRAVAIQARTQPTDAHPRASFDRSLPPSYSRRPSFDCGPSPPPVDLKSHPNRRRLSGASIHRSSPRDIITYENTEIDSGVRDMSNSVDSGVESIFDMENGDRSSYLDELPTGSMEERDVQRHSTLPSSQPPNFTATCKPSQHAQEYIEMHPRAAQVKDNYVLMQSVGPVQLDGSPPRSLSPITATESRKAHRFAPTSYENHMLPSEGQKFVMYQTSYENVEPTEGAFSFSSGKSPKNQPVCYIEGGRLTPPVIVEMPSVS